MNKSTSKKARAKDTVKEEIYKQNICYLIVKRLLDIIIGIVGILFLIPLTILVKIAYVSTGDFNSIFYTHERIGKNGKIFKLLKYRSMIPNSDEILKKLLENDKKLALEYKKNKKLENDPRITKVGKTLRKLSLDEMPQFINILAGHMSVVGNRPYLVREKKDMGKYYDDIIKTKPGITGYWQVSGRSDVSFNKRLKMEKYYSLNASLKMDIKIFFKTFKVVLYRDGAK